MSSFLHLLRLCAMDDRITMWLSFSLFKFVNSSLIALSFIMFRNVVLPYSLTDLINQISNRIYNLHLLLELLELKLLDGQIGVSCGYALLLRQRVAALD